MRLYGKNPVLERLKADPKSIRQILIEQGHKEAGYIHQKGKQWGIPVRTVPYTKIQKLAHNLNTQGILAEIDEFPYMGIDDLLSTAKEKKWAIVFLDNLTDPQNLGGIMRTCGSLGNFAIILPTTESVNITDTVLRVACGGDNYVVVSRVANLGHAIDKAKTEGFWIMGTAVRQARSIFEVTMQFPLGLVLGSEGKGVREIIRKKLDQEVMIPVKHERMSLNVAHAASIICYEIVRSRHSAEG